MTKSRGVWKHEDAALLLIDYQKEMFDTVRSETPAELIDLNVLAHRTAVERLAHAGAVPNTSLAIVCELFRDWKSPLAGKAREIVKSYQADLQKLQ